MDGKITLTADPVDFTDISIARSRADAIMNDLDGSFDTLDLMGIAFDRGLYDTKSAPVREGARHVLFVSELAAAKVTAWSGLGDVASDEPLPCTPENIRAVMRASFLIADAFWQKMLHWHVEHLKAKKGFAVGANGMPSPVPAASTVKTAE